MRRRAHEQLHLREDCPAAVDAVQALEPLLAPLRAGRWRLMVLGAQGPRERDEAATLAARILDLADAVLGR